MGVGFWGWRPSAVSTTYVRTSLLRTLIKAERYCYSTALFMMSERPAGGGVNDDEYGWRVGNQSMDGGGFSFLRDVINEHTHTHNHIIS